MLLLVSCQVPRSVTPLTAHEVAAADPTDERLTVLLHGYGSNEKDLLILTEPLGLAGPIISYRAPEPGGHGFAWFPIDFTSEGSRYDADAADAIVLRLAAELRGLRAQRKGPLVVVGYSQGAMLAMLLAAEHPDTLDAAVALSGALPRKPIAAPKTAPVFMAHGTKDPIVPPERARTARTWLSEAGVDAELLEVEGVEHRISRKALDGARSWLKEVCAAQGCPPQ